MSNDAARHGLKAIRTPTGHLMVLREGADVLAEIATLAEREAIPSASFVGMGFLSEVTFGFYDFGKKAFDPKSFRNVELASMTGTIAWQNGKPSIHAHGVVAGADFIGVGGHLLGLTVGTGSLEITIIRHETRLERIVDPGIKANILQL
ncbi:PPC domain-containing DNA-binding protein [Bosea sp. (in: a-proteobacteria)]|jgi:predicted DNA-binding protein with PD1-like motif|uniref:PPC domain-containing DNA-binding protein n=1 Tax=Bosea sp. (in: a-proteobacteria) TaxID=1871050 RepID=UPI003F713F40